MLPPVQVMVRPFRAVTVTVCAEFVVVSSGAASVTTRGLPLVRRRDVREDRPSLAVRLPERVGRRIRLIRPGFGGGLDRPGIPHQPRENLNAPPVDNANVDTRPRPRHPTRARPRPARTTDRADRLGPRRHDRGRRPCRRRCGMPTWTWPSTMAHSNRHDSRSDPRPTATCSLNTEAPISTRPKPVPTNTLRPHSR